MRKRYGVTGPVLATSLLLVGLTACSGSDSSDTIKSADSSPTHSAKNKHKRSSSSPSSGDTPTSKPTFDFPQDVKVKVDADKTGDPVKDEILRDHKYAMFAEQEGLAMGKPGKFFGRYFTGAASIKQSGIFADYKKDQLSITGKDHFYSRRVISHTKKTAVVKYCEDQTKTFDKNKDTGKPVNHTFDPKAYMSMRTMLKKSKFGTWRVFYLHGVEGDSKCRKES